MKFLRISLLLCAISFAFLAKAQEISPSFYKYHPLPPTPDTFVATEMITIPDGIQSITKDEKTGQVTVTDTKGVKHVLPQGKDVAVADENGRGALVDKHGQITNTTAEQAKAAAKREYGFSIVFEKATESKAGFDTYDKKTTALKNTYETIDQYHVPWKAISTGADAVKGSINMGTAKDLVFEQDGAKLTYNEFTNILTVNPAAAGSTAQVIVKEKTGDKEKIRGKLNIAGYAPISKTVHIVPVNNATCTISEADLKTYLDNVYGQALVSWQVDKKNKIDVSFTGDFDDGGSGLLSTYTGDMRKVINAYGSMEPEHCYIFLIENGKTKTGYMPRGKQAGFVFLNNQNAEDIKHTIAHELGHGAFTLRHPFAEYPAVTAKSTDNLMDYAGGTHLYKWQWDQIHNPVLVIGLFEGDSEGEKDRVEIKIVCSISDKTVADGKVLIKNDTSRTVKLKYDIADITKTKVTYKIEIEMDSANTKMTYPKTGVDTLLFNVEKTLLLDSLPQGKYTITCYNKKKVMTLNFFIRKKKLEITKEQLKEVFKDTDSSILEQVTTTINSFAEKFELTTTNRMAHFLAQTGYESDGFKASKGETGCYTSTNTEGWKIWFSKTWAEPPFGVSCDKSLHEAVKGNKKIKWTALECKKEEKNCVAVPSEYVCATTNSIKGDDLTKKLFSYVYQCEGGNGDSASENGYTYRGHGAIQLTWKKSYEAFDKWLKDNYKEKYKDIVATPTIMDTDKEIFVLSAMWFWNTNNLNKDADDDKFDDITQKVNRGKEKKDKRLKILNNLKIQLK